jgi:hypothetical protein
MHKRPGGRRLCYTRWYLNPKWKFRITTSRCCTGDDLALANPTQGFGPTEERLFMKKRVNSAWLLGFALALPAPSYAQTKPPFTLAWVNGEFSCKLQYGGIRTIDNYSQVFSFCTQDGLSPQQIAKLDRSNLEQAAKAACGSGALTPTSLSTGTYHGAGDMAGAQKELDADRTANRRLGNIIADFHVTVPYSGKCQ